MLTDDDGSPFAGLEILGYQQYAPGEYVLPDVEHDLVADPLLGVVDLSCASIEGQEDIVELTQHFFSKILTERLGAFDELIRGDRLVTQLSGPVLDPEFGRDLVQEETLPDVLRVADQSLHVSFDLHDLSPLSLGNIKRSATLCRRLAHKRQRGPNAE